MRRLPAPLLGWLLLTSGCVPELDDHRSRIDSPRVLAVRASPAEVEEGGALRLDALIAARDSLEPELEWVVCLAQKPLSELGPASRACLSSSDLPPEIGVRLGRGTSIETTIPEDACRVFGPERPEPKAGEPAGRPTDPDTSGGFYQPFIGWLDAEAALARVRLRCPLIGATREATIEYNRARRPNENPAPSAFELVRASGDVLGLTAPDAPRLSVNEQVTLRVTFPRCPEVAACGDGVCSTDEDVNACREDCSRPRGCGGVERYPLYVPAERALVLQDERLTTSFYATGGELAEGRVDENTPVPAGSASHDTWSAPARSGPVKLWAVVRDDRGGVGFITGRVIVEE